MRNLVTRSKRKTDFEDVLPDEVQRKVFGLMRDEIKGE
jgi:hypothetical protein